MLPIILATYGTVFVAEIVGDKLLYTTGVLATRYKTVPIMCGMAMAFMLKMGVAVYVSKFIAHLPPWLVATITALNFIGIAIVLWRKPDKREIKQYPASRAVGVSFAAIFFSEWGDVGQLTAAGMALHYTEVPQPYPHVLRWCGSAPFQPWSPRALWPHPLAPACADGFRPTSHPKSSAIAPWGCSCSLECSR
jgi:hypothetical protein